MRGFLPASHICRPDRHSCSVCLPQQKLSHLKIAIEGGGDWICFPEVFHVPAASTWVECFTLIHTVHVHTDAVWS